MKNSSDLREAGAVLAAEFLKEFSGDGPWAHLDIAGPGIPRPVARRLPVAAGRQRLRRETDRRARNAARSLNFDLTEEQQLVRETVREFARERVAPVAAELDREQRFPYDLVAELAELGLMGMTIPEEYGGSGADTLAYAIVVEELTRIDSSLAITLAAHHSLGHAADLLLRERGAEAAVASRPRVGTQARRVRPDGAGRRLGRRRDAHDRGAARRAVDRQRLEDLHHERRHRHHGVRDDHRAHRRRRDLEHHRPERHARLHDLAADAQARLARVRHARALVRELRRAGGEPARPARRRASSSSCRSSTAAASRSRRWASGSRRAPTTSRTRTRRSASSSASRSRSSRPCSSSSPTWRRRSRPAARSSTRRRG